eukprot:358374-Chlamydomonas_euryale.AAC.8
MHEDKRDCSPPRPTPVGLVGDSSWHTALDLLFECSLGFFAACQQASRATHCVVDEGRRVSLGNFIALYDPQQGSTAGRHLKAATRCARHSWHTVCHEQ